ncbi:MAG TPA: hypothetical protein VMO26_10955 [Vicinamibacterales bacterium]|nr:hypothetical protein [Vicinamibacterales bacterium]
MSDRPVELEAILTEVRRRWTRRSRWRASMLGAAAAAVIVLTGWSAVALLAPDGIPLLVISGFVLATAIFAIARAGWSVRGAPTDRQVARLIEERETQLDDVVATAVDYGARPDATPRMRQALFGDAARAVAALGDRANLDRVLSRQSVRRAWLRAAGAFAVLAIAVAGFAPSLWRAANVASAYLFPARLTVAVTPGSTKVLAGEPMTITARIGGFEGEVVPTLTVAVGDESRSLRMSPGEDAGTFAVTVESVRTSFAYTVSAANARSDNYAITVIRPPRVERIDLHYEFPRGVGLEPRTDEDSGDIYGPPGTKVRLTIAADKPIASAFLLLDDGSKLPLIGNAELLDGGLTIDGDGSYRIALLDHDGLESPGDTEYFIRTLHDRPPDVRILRPASDKHVMPLEEVQIAARADDDFGIASLEIVFQTPSGKERAVPIGVAGGLTASGVHTLFMEDLNVQPGDFVTYYARARDVNRGRRSTEARSDIFFLEVQPFEEEFVAAQSQQQGQGAGMQGGALEDLAEAQKQIIVATWNLDARARRARGVPSPQDVTAVSKAQSELRDRAEQVSAQAQRMSDPRRRRRTGGPAPGEDPIGKAVEAMDRAVTELDRFSTSSAMPHEMEALNHLLRAEAENRRRQVSRSQQAGGGGGQNRSEADLSSLFDQELRKRQQTNYESPNSTEEREEQEQTDPLERIRELARRQDALNRQQQDLARAREQMDEEELKRQLERLTRDQNELRQQAQQLAEQMQQSGQTGGRGSQGQDESRRLREASEDMRNAATGLRQQDGAQASQSGDRAAERLRDLEQRMQASRPDDRRRALGDLQLETRQLADQQRRLASEAGRTARGPAGDDARRRLAGEQERLADRAERLEEQVQRLSRAGQGDSNERRATEEAARELSRQNVADRMRQSADAMRQGSPLDAQPQDVAKALDRVAEQLSAASGAQSADARRASEQLGRAQELRDRMRELDRSIEQLQRESQAQQRGQPQAPQPGAQQGAQGAPAGAQGEGTSGQGGGSAAGTGGRLEQLQREVNEQMGQAQRLAESIRRETPGLGANMDSSWWPSFSAPGTEAFKQDFSRWESLKSSLLVALEDVETQRSGELRAQELKERFNVGGHEAVSDAYRELVDKYYRSLAAPRPRP